MSAPRERALHGAGELLDAPGDASGFCSPASLPPPTRPQHVANGHCASAPPRSSVPKMGIRARVADWPPSRERSQDPLLENGGRGGRGAAGPGPFRRGPALLPHRRRRAKDAEFRNGLGGSSPSLFRGPPAPPLQRSSSELTLSEQDPAEAGSGPGERAEPEAGLFREYGSTSSIDAAAVPEQSLFRMLSQFHREQGRDTPPRAAAPDEPRGRQKGGPNEGSSSSSLFRKLRMSARAEAEAEEGAGPWTCPRSFAHYDAQSVLFDLRAAGGQRSGASSSQCRNTATGASAASSSSSSSSSSALLPAPERAEPEDTPLDTGRPPAPPDGCHGDRLLLSCPHFRVEAAGYAERDVGFLRSGRGQLVAAATACRSNASVSVLEVPPELQATRLERLRQHSIEHVDMGARYYRQHFHNKEHSNYFGTDATLGPVALSIRREKLDDTKELKDQYQYRIIFRTTELVTLRGSVLEDSVPSLSRHGSTRGLPLKDVLESLVPELGVACLRLALSSPKVTEQLLKLDEQGLSQKHKVGILLCRAGQSMEEEMYNNEEATPPFSAFLELLGEQVCLRGFSKYAAQLDTKTDSTGTHSLYTAYQDYEVMFHVSTMLPYMPNNPQQLLRKRHIGNDIVTIIFQEPGALPFTPQNIRSQFQHVFVIVRVHNPCSDSTCYSVAVTSMEDVPPFGPPIPEGEAFRDPEAFRDFLLAKVINAENAAHKSDKFHTMAARTRREYLRDLAENCVSGTPLDSAGKLNNLISLASKRRERARARDGAELDAAGAVAWRVRAQDFGGGGGTGAELPCLLAVSREYVVLVDSATKEVVFNCFCADVIGWTLEHLALKIYFGRGDHIGVSVLEGSASDVREVVQRLKALTVGSETAEMTLRRNGLGQLGFHVRLDGTVAEVEEYGFAWQAGLRQGSRLVEICKVAAVTLSHEQMIDLLRTSVTVKVLIIPPFAEGGARRGCTEEYEMKMNVDQIPESPLARTHKVLVPVSYREPPHGLSKRPVSFPENHYSDRAPPFRNPSASFSFVQYKPSPDRYGTPQRPLLGFESHLSRDMTSSGESGFTSQDSTMERCKTGTQTLQYLPEEEGGGGGGGVGGVGGTGVGVPKRSRRQDVLGKDSPNRNNKGEAPYSSHSSSNTLSSNASSSHSDERWFDGVGPGGGVEPCRAGEADPDPLGKRGSSDSGIDGAALYSPNPVPPCAWDTHNPVHKKNPAPAYSVPQELTRMGRDSRRRAESRPGPASGPARQGKTYNTRTFPLPSAPSDAHKPSRACYTPQGFKVSAVDRRQPARAATVTLSSGSARPEPTYCQNRHPNTVQQHQGMCTSSGDSNSTSQRYSGFNIMQHTVHHREGYCIITVKEPEGDLPVLQVDGNLKNVFGQPRLRASLRDLRSPRRAHKSTIEDDLKKLIIMDNIDTPHRDTSPPRRALHRTFSDESLNSGRRDGGFPNAPPYDGPITPADLLFTSTLPTRRPAAHGDPLANKKAAISASELSLTEVRDRVPPLRTLDPGLMPLPNTACGLEWASLVNAAKAYEVQRTVSLFSLSEPRAGGPEMRQASNTPPQNLQPPRATPNLSSDEVPGDLSGRLYNLELMLKQLNKDLEKEKQDKVALLAEVANLRQNNQRLQEESQSASEQLRNLSQLFTGAPGDRK
ncbi:hypothetical protein AAFF_G00313000 [Aldrovandia affinis]|uniref:Signal-induced proliferation-associated 1-like protein 3 n=1 Tax=Aldrovandia affinis TaxID=143900 RepID=A0AAD7SNU2_9TELE|nr:hypothetical protein AAFF_G00313000 [Aldrovandia affinis]